MGWTKVKEFGSAAVKEVESPPEAQLDKELEAKVLAAVQGDNPEGVTVREMKEYIKGKGYEVEVAQPKSDLFEDLKNIEV
jgi:DNA-directed RNA polymerase specialized sigma54-like protein